MQEALNQVTMSGVVRVTAYVVKLTLTIEFIGGTILALRWFSDYGWKGIYFGYWHAISNFCNAGFDLIGEFRSLTPYVDDVVVNLVVTTLIILGGIGFTVIADVLTNRSFGKFALHTKLVLVTTAVLLVVGTLGILALESDNPDTIADLSWTGKLLGSYFQSVTARTAGANTLDIGKMESGTLFLIVILMFIGASPASTGGGIKTSTAGVLAASIWAMITGKEDAQMFARRIPIQTIHKAFAVVFISAAVVVLVTLILSVTENAPFINILFETTSAFGTVGLSTGITPSLSVIGKLLLSLTMFTGRVGPVTLALAIALRAQKAHIKYPEGKIIIG
jgi:trk system potassium uptake protein TrkH